MPGIPEELAGLRTSDEVLVVVDVGGNILLLSEPAEEFFGIGLDDVAGEAMELLMPEEFRDNGALDTVVHDTPWGTHLVPASKALATAERALGEVGRGGATQRLKRGLDSGGEA